jgi:hypothetical protein
LWAVVAGLAMLAVVGWWTVDYFLRRWRHR